MADSRVTTPDVVSADGSTTLTVQRACNGCGRTLGDATDAEMEAAVQGRPLPDVRSECGCFPSDASLGAASTTLNPPPGEHAGDQQ